MKPVDVRQLLESPGSSKNVQVSEPVDGLKLGLVEVESPVEARLRLDATGEGVWASGTLSGRAELVCARCLKPFEAGFSVEVGELFASDPDDEDDYAVADPGEIDLEPMIRDAVLLAMPFSPLCREDCKGLCARCGGDRNLGECSCPEVQADPRWAGLEGFAENT
jgi:uncharacterized protein